MDTVNISIKETEKIMNYAPNYFRRLNHTLAKYTKRSVYNETGWFFLVEYCGFGVGGGVGVVLHTMGILYLLTGICKTTWFGVL